MTFDCSSLFSSRRSPGSGAQLLFAFDNLMVEKVSSAISISRSEDTHGRLSDYSRRGSFYGKFSLRAIEGGHLKLSAG